MRPTRDGGQALAEFAIVVPVFMLMLAGMIQFGVILWGQNTLNQVVRDAGRYAATLTTCTAGTPGDPATPVGRIVVLANQSSGAWRLDTSRLAATYRTTDPVTNATVALQCPPDDNQVVTWVKVSASSDAFVFFPWVPGDGHLSSSVEFRMEPAP